MARAFGASLLLLVLAGAGVAAAVDIGHEDGTGVGIAVTGSKPESKLWFNDGKWWASMWSTSPAGFYIYRLDGETWVRTGTALDPRAPTRADTLWDGNKLYVASQQWSEDGGHSGSGTNHEARLYRFSYNAGTDAYALDGGFPVVMRDGIQSESLVIAKDSNDTLWATWTLDAAGSNRVYTSHTVGSDATWSSPEALPVAGVDTADDDISSIIAFTVGSEHRIGVFWSNQEDKKDYFAWQPDGGADDDWTVETALSTSTGGPNPADDHMNLKTDSSGKVYAVVKTSNSGSQPLILLLTRAAAGGWSVNTVGRVSDSNTRAIVELDTSDSTLHVFMTGPLGGSGSGQEGGEIVEKTSPTSSISFAIGEGTVVIRDDGSADLNNATSTKQNVNSSSGIVVLAYNDSTLRYWHHHDGPSGPTANFTGSPTSGTWPLAVTFNNTSNGTGPLTYAWTFGDGATSTAENPSHTYNTAGQFDVTLTVTDDVGNATRTRNNYINVTAPTMPDANFAGSPTSGTSPLTVDFSNTSTGTAPLTYAWDFGDGGTSTEATPTHTYNPGTWTVTLTATNAAGSNTMTRNNYIHVDAPPGSRFHALDPVRVLDTRSHVGLNGVFHANTARTFTVADGTPIPTNAVAVTGNLTVTGQTSGGFVVLAPAAGGSTSTINFPAGDTRANAVTVALGSGGTLNAVYKAKAGATTHLVFDVTGYFTQSSDGSRSMPWTRPGSSTAEATSGSTGCSTPTRPGPSRSPTGRPSRPTRSRSPAT